MYSLAKNVAINSREELALKIQELSASVLSPYSFYDSQVNPQKSIFLWKFTSFNNIEFFFALSIENSQISWECGRLWDTGEERFADSIFRYPPNYSISYGFSLSICIVRNLDLFGVFVSQGQNTYSSIVLMPSVYDSEMWEGFDLFFVNQEERNPGNFYPGTLNNPYGFRADCGLSYCRDGKFSEISLSGKISVLSGIFLEDPLNSGIAGGLSPATGIAPTGFIPRFSLIPSSLVAGETWLSLYKSDGGLVIRENQ